MSKECDELVFHRLFPDCAKSVEQQLEAWIENSVPSATKHIRSLFYLALSLYFVRRAEHLKRQVREEREALQ